MKEYQKDERIYNCRLLDLIDYFDIAGYFTPLQLGKIIPQYLYQLVPSQHCSQINRLVSLLIFNVAIDSLNQHSLYNILISILDCQHQRS